MKKTLLILAVFSMTIAQAQETLPYTQDFESATIGQNPTVNLTPTFAETVSPGTNSITISNGTGTNSTQVLRAEATAFDSTKNHYVTSPTFSCTAGSAYTIQLDLYATNTGTNFNIKASSDGTTYDKVSPSDVTGTVTVGTFENKFNKKGALTGNEIKDHQNGWTTATIQFEAPAGQTSFVFELYKFDVNVIELDNISVAVNGAASVESVSKNRVQLLSNPIDDSLTLQSSYAVSKATLINMTGTHTELSEINNNTFDTSSVKSGFYILNILLKDGSGQSLKVIKK
jgi:hypothetical protein